MLYPDLDASRKFDLASLTLNTDFTSNFLSLGQGVYAITALPFDIQCNCMLLSTSCGILVAEQHDRPRVSVNGNEFNRQTTDCANVI